MSYDPDNIFAKILRGDLPCIRLFEDDHTLSFMDIMPQADGHALVVPKEPAEMLLDLSPDSAAACIRTTQRVALAVRAAMQVPGIFIAQMNGAAAGQTVPHCHFHIIPRTQADALRMHAVVREDDDRLRGFAERIRAALDQVRLPAARAGGH
jgi:histidine triad (HIT) family protein